MRRCAGHRRPDEKLEIIVRNGRVVLEGTVEYWYELVAAVKASSPVSDQIAIKSQRLADADVATEIGEAIARRTSGADRIAIDVKVGAVTLRGSALTPHDRFQAEKAAWSTKGADRDQRDRSLVVGTRRHRRAGGALTVHGQRPPDLSFSLNCFSCGHEVGEG